MSPTKHVLPALILVSTLLTPIASAAPAVKLIGVDDATCSAWTSSKSDPDERKTYLVWVGGVLTGHNYTNQRQQISSISNGTIENFVDRYCAENPKGSFSDAAMRMSDRFSGRNEPLRK